MTVNELAAALLAALEDRGMTLATAESCTGGMVGAALTAVPGSSRAYLGGVISYTNGVKAKLLGVPGPLLENPGAVSAPVAAAMARGARLALGAELAVSVTGLAGPGGDGSGNPVGTVFLGLSASDGEWTRAFCFPGGRAQIREAACREALLLAQSYFQG